MATSQQGYQCKFLDFVSEDLYCKKCALVAQRLTVATCCGESFCHECLVESTQQDKSCPACRLKNFTTFEQIKLQKQINCLRVYCNMEERGCDWSGPLEQLDAHLNPDLDNCQYVDTNCPLNCCMAVPKNKVNEHLIKECVKRAFTCQYCNFKGTYEEVVDTHLTECKYVPLKCPNMCGVTCEREVMEDHMKICRLEDVECEFKGVGCNNWFRREDQEDHTRQNTHKHLTLTAFQAIETKEQLQQMIGITEKKIEEVLNLEFEYKETVEILRHLVQKQNKDQEKKMNDLQRKLMEQEKKVKELEKKHEEQNKKSMEYESKRNKEEMKLKQVIEDHNKVQKLELEKYKQLLEQQNSKVLKLEQLLLEYVDKSVEHEERLSEMSTSIGNNRHFTIENFSQIKPKGKTWKSPAMYTHFHGYKVCIEVIPNAFAVGKTKYLGVNLWILVGEFDDQLKWPTSLSFTIEVVNQHGGENVICNISKWTIQKPSGTGYNSGTPLSMRHSKLNDFLKNDTLFFHISEFKVL